MIHQTAGESVFKIHKNYINFHAKHQDQVVQTSKDQSKLGRNTIDIWNHRSSDEGIKKKIEIAQAILRKQIIENIYVKKRRI